MITEILLFDIKCDILANRNFPKGFSQQLVSFNVNGRQFTVLFLQSLKLTSFLVRSYAFSPALCIRLLTRDAFRAINISPPIYLQTVPHSHRRSYQTGRFISTHDTPSHCRSMPCRIDERKSLEDGFQVKRKDKWA